MDPSTETATQALHRITSYGRYDASDPDLNWAPPVDDPRVVADLVVNDTDRLPWFYKRYPDDLPTMSLPRDLPTTSRASRGPRRSSSRATELLRSRATRA